MSLPREILTSIGNIPRDTFFVDFVYFPLPTPLPPARLLEDGKFPYTSGSSTVWTRVSSAKGLKTRIKQAGPAERWRVDRRQFKEKKGEGRKEEKKEGTGTSRRSVEKRGRRRHSFITLSTAHRWKEQCSDDHLPDAYLDNKTSWKGFSPNTRGVINGFKRTKTRRLTRKDVFSMEKIPFPRSKHRKGYDDRFCYLPDESWRTVNHPTDR